MAFRLLALLGFGKHNGPDYFDTVRLGGPPAGACAYPQPAAPTPTATSTATP